MRALRQFIEVANRRSISRAAEHLNISQPALSRAIRQLEDTYGVELFVRTGNGVALSSFGTALYSSAVRAMRALDEAQEEIDLLKGNSKASIRIAAGDLWGLVILPEIIKRFTDLHPEIMVNLSVIDDTSRHEGLRNGVFDVVFGIPWTNYSGVLTAEFEPLVRQGAYIYCDKDHELASIENVQQSDLAAQRWVRYGFDDERSVLPGRSMKREYSVRADTLLHAVPILQGSSLLISASSGFEGFLAQFGIVSIGVDELGLVSSSGPIYTPRILEKRHVSDFVKLTRNSAPRCNLPDWPED